MARPTKLTTEIVTRLAQAIGVGASYDLAAKFAGIAPSTFFDWKARAEQAAGRLLADQEPEDGDGAYLDFLEAVERAEGSAAVGWLAKIEQAANSGEWRAAAWKLEKRHPHIYGRNIIEHDGEVTAQLPATLLSAINRIYGTPENGDGNSSNGSL
jgi:hypothetical protein